MAEVISHDKLHVQLKELKVIHTTLSTYLENKIKKALKELHIKDRDKKILGQVEEYLGYNLDELFNSIKYSLQVDGLAEEKLREIDINEYLNDPNKINEKIEPYDFAMNDKLRNLYLHVEDTIEEISKLRKSKPEDYYTLYKEKYISNEKLIDDIVQQNTVTREELLKQLDEESSEEVEDNDDLDVQEDIRDILKDLVDLKKEIPETKQKFNNLCNVVDFVSNEK